MDIELFAFWAILICTLFTAFTNVIQIVISWYQLRELGDLDHDKTDWWEKLRKKKKRRKNGNKLE